MKTKNLFALAAGCMLLFAACEKRSETFYRVNGDRITFDVALDNPTTTGKQAFNGPAKRCFFTAGDSIYINHTGCAVTPIASATVPGSSATFSPMAQMTTTLSNDGSYEFAYPYSKISFSDSEWRAYLPEFVIAMDDNLSNYDISAARGFNGGQNPVWPMYFSTQDIESENAVVLRNTCAFISTRLNLGPEWFNQNLSPTISECLGETYTFTSAPDLCVFTWYLTSSEWLSGDCYINKTNPSTPFLKISNDPTSTKNQYVFAYTPSGTWCYDNSHPGTQDVTNSLGVIPVIPLGQGPKNFQLRIGASFEIDHGISVSVTITTPMKTITDAIERNHLYYMNVNMVDANSGVFIESITLQAPEYK